MIEPYTRRSRHAMARKNAGEMRMKRLMLAVWNFVCGGESACADCGLAAIARTYADRNMARNCPGFAANDRPGADGDGYEGPGRRTAVVVYRQRLQADDDRVFAEREKHWSRGGGVSRRRLRNLGDRSGRYGGLRLADVKGNHLCAAKVPRAPGRRISETCVVSEVGAISGIANCAGRCAANDGAGSPARGGVAYRSAQGWSAGIFRGRPFGGGDQHPVSEALVSGGRCGRSEKAVARTLPWRCIPDICRWLRRSGMRRRAGENSWSRTRRMPTKISP